jgi:hypothetical protein
MTGGTTLLSSTTFPTIGDDVATALTSLPFAFNFFGAPVTQYSAQTNGMMQLFAAGAAVSSTAYANVAIPTAGAPDGFLAPFWDDLTPSGSTTAHLSAATFGTAPNRHLTVEWSAMALLGSTTELLTFQAHLFEGSNVVEYHYCGMAAGSTLATGGSATIGIEDPTGADGTQHSFNTASSVSDSGALRFTPN